MSSASRPAFGPTCPVGGTWYACASGSSFVGCCGTYGQDVCTLNCAQGNLYSASFNGSQHGTFPDASCEAGSNFYTCNGTNPAFLGCCKTNPCATGCPKNNLTPAFLGTDALKQAYGAVSAGSNSRSSSTILTSSTATAASGTSTTTGGKATKDAAATAKPNEVGPNVGAIAGGAVGGAFALAVIIGLLIYFFCYTKRSRKGHQDTLERRQSDLPAMTNAREDPKGVYSPGAPPGYVSPNPNDNYRSHAGPNHYQQQFISGPQELPVEATSAGYVTHKAALHQRNVSELSGDTAMRSELETPLGPPHEQSHFATPVESPQSQSSATWQDASSPQRGSNGVAHQTWPSQSGQDHSPAPAQGLGLYGVIQNEATAPGHR